MAGFWGELRRRLGGVWATVSGKQRLELDARLQRLEDAVGRANKRLVKLERGVSDSREGLRGSLRRVERELGALIRMQGFEPETVPYPQRLTVQRFRLSSQNEEDGILYALLRERDVEHRSFVELGCGTNGGNSGFLARELGWKGLMVDGDERNVGAVRQRFASAKVATVQAWITRDNVDELIVDAGLAGEVGLLSIDIDGNDYWIWQSISACSPLVVVIEYNSLFGPKRSVTVPYREGFDRHDFPRARDGKAIYFGASLEALARLGRRKGYRLACVEPRGVNAFFLRRDYRPEIPEVSPKDCFRVLDKYIGHDLMKLVQEHELPLEEIG